MVSVNNPSALHVFYMRNVLQQKLQQQNFFDLEMFLNSEFHIGKVPRFLPPSSITPFVKTNFLKCSLWSQLARFEADCFVNNVKLFKHSKQRHQMLE